LPAGIIQLAVNNRRHFQALRGVNPVRYAVSYAAACAAAGYAAACGGHAAAGQNLDTGIHFMPAEQESNQNQNSPHDKPSAYICIVYHDGTRFIDIAPGCFSEFAGFLLPAILVPAPLPCRPGAGSPGLVRNWESREALSCILLHYL